MSKALNTVYRKKKYKIYSAGNEYIIHNSNLDFENHHTHISNFNTCVYIINLCIHKSVPKHLSDYLLISIIRLTDDNVYKKQIENKLEKNKYKKGKHYNGKSRNSNS